MQPDNNKTDKEKIRDGQKPDEHVEEAFRAAEKDIQRDADEVTPEEVQSDLDEGELARKEGHP
jgi:hypothetical protein